MKLGKTILMIVAGLQGFSSIMLLIGSGAATFEADTGVPWKELVSVYPTVAEQYLIAQKASLIGNIGLSLLALAILAFAFKPPHVWAWYALWVVPASMLPGTLDLAQSVRQAGVAVFGGIIITLAVAALLISYREINQTPT